MLGKVKIGTIVFSCGGLLVKRYGYIIEKNLLSRGCCPGCGQGIDGVWQD